MGPEALAQVLRPLSKRFPSAKHPAVIVGLDALDDAAVLRLDATTAAVVTTDFFPPVVDDPYAFGGIAAANAMSDVYAMGGEVLLALNLAVFPEDLPLMDAHAIIAGGADKVAEAGGVLAGGHTVAGREPMYGLAVLGRARPDRLLRKNAARPGDLLVLTKPLGSGLITTALRNGDASADHVQAAMSIMAQLNRGASRAALEVGAVCATDVTGFGLLGHALEVADGSGVRLCFQLSKLPLMAGALDYARAGAVPGGTWRNRSAYERRVVGQAAKEEPWSSLLYDPQTSGGLLVALDPAVVQRYLASVADAGGQGTVVGHVVAGSGVVVE
jgi:selenide,water dikinase